MRYKYLDLFKDISTKIDDALKGVFGTDKAKEKLNEGAFGDVTVYVDKIAEDIMLESMKSSGFPCSVLSEETGLVYMGSKQPLVIVDPIDGSLNSKRGVPYFAFSIALSEGFTTDDISVGYVKNLSNEDEFYAVKGEGAYLNSKRIKTESKGLNIAAVEGFKRTSNPELIKFVFERFNKVRQMGSMALDMCYLATGAFDIFLNVVPSRIIDYAAAKIVLNEAGGNIYQWINEEPFKADVSMQKGGLFFCLSNPEFLNKFLSMTEDLR